ncbi:2Fe-2S iron-sulfur cluster-binding protein [Streptomyces sp. NPDC088921]|uniref:2Fe-2S iron-sulfur cluster-binding protein n=1 Tax=unclassified Streptomyces TaxID=2593676 RepID=UPI003427C66B
MSRAPANLGIAPARIHSEIFGSLAAIRPGLLATPSRAPHLPARPPGDGTGCAVVPFARSGITVPWDPAYGTLLELAEACDVPAQWSCCTGVCHTCETALLQGQVAYSPVRRPRQRRPPRNTRAERAASR